MSGRQCLASGVSGVVLARHALRGVQEALALHWEDVDLVNGAVEIKYTVVRIKGEGLVRKSTKTAAGERMLTNRRRLAVEQGRPDASSVFADSDGGLRAPQHSRRAAQCPRDRRVRLSHLACL